MNPHFENREKCPGCNSTDNSQIYSISYLDEDIRKYLKDFYTQQGSIDFDYLKNVDFVLLKCKNCELVFQKYIPNDELMYILYEKWINPEYNLSLIQNFGIEYYEKNAFEIIDLIRYFNQKPANLKFLDFGMGWGTWCQMSNAFGVNTEGMELSEKRIQNAQRNGVMTINWEQMKDNKYDFINTEQVFEHISNPLDTLLVLKNSLNNNGLIKISVPNSKNITKILNNINWSLPKTDPNSVNVFAPLEHINSFNTKAIIIMAEKAGLKLVSNVRKRRNKTAKERCKEVLRPFYSKIIKREIEDTSLFFNIK